MQTKTTKSLEAITFERRYPGTTSQAQRVRADLTAITGGCPVAEDLILLAHELAVNAIVHSRSGHPGQGFTVRAALYPGDHARVEVTDLGGPWAKAGQDDEHGRGLAIVAAIAGEGNWGTGGDDASHVAWFRLDWHQGQPS